MAMLVNQGLKNCGGVAIISVEKPPPSAVVADFKQFFTYCYLGLSVKDIMDTEKPAYETSGMTCYIAARYENSKGDHGPWGSVVTAIIPL